VRAKKPLRPIWTTTVDPSEYDYVAQFTQTVKWANKNKELYPPTDVGKVWGLVQAYQRLERENAALREAGHLAEKIVVQRTDEIGHLERENAALRHTEENLVATVRGLEFELEKAQKTVVALREAALALISELDVEAFDRVGRPKGEMLYEHVGPLRAAVNAARAGEEVRRE
jgi:hypothetical protein